MKIYQLSEEAQQVIELVGLIAKDSDQPKNRDYIECMLEDYFDQFDIEYTKTKRGNNTSYQFKAENETDRKQDVKILITFAKGEYRQHKVEGVNFTYDMEYYTLDY